MEVYRRSDLHLLHLQIVRRPEYRQSMRGRLMTGITPILALVVVAAVVGALHGGFTDLFVYRYGGRAVLDGLPLYESDDPVTGLPFTYPPFAAVAMVPLALLPAWLAAALWTGASVGALAAVVVVVRRALGRPAPGWLVALVTARRARPGAGVAEPHVRTGQPVPDAGGAGRPAPTGTALVRRAGGHRGGREADPARVRRAAGAGRTSDGRGTGGAGLRRHRRGRVRRDAGLGGDVLDRRPVRREPGRPAGAGPQPVGVRRAHPAPRRPAADPAVARGRRCRSHSRCWSSAPTGGARGDRVLGTCLGAMAMLLASPVSWSHHWVWAVPVALVLWERSRWAGVAWTAVFVARPIVWPPLRPATASTGGVRSTTSSATPTCSPPSLCASGSACGFRLGIGLRSFGSIACLPQIGEQGVEHRDPGSERERSDRYRQPRASQGGCRGQHHGRP